jgi:ArsR family transcriptional regulator
MADTAALASPELDDVEAKFFRGLGDPLRMRLLQLLADGRELALNELMLAVGEPRSRVQLQLACLRACGFVVARRDGRFLYHRLRDERLGALLTAARLLAREPASALAQCAVIDPRPLELVAPDASPASDFGQWLRAQLQRRGLEVRALAQALGVSGAAVRRWLYRGGYPAPALRARLAELLELPPAELRARVREREALPASEFAGWLAEQLSAHDWTPSELAARLRLDRHTITAWQRRGALPRPATRHALAQLLEVRPEAIPAR